MTEAVRDFVIIGAGPAGLAAAAEARDLELDSLILDEQPEPGGQVYRSASRVVDRRPADLRFLGADYARGAALVAAARVSSAAKGRRSGKSVRSPAVCARWCGPSWDRRGASGRAPC